METREIGEGRPIIFVHGWRLDGAVEAADYEPHLEGVSGWRRIYPDLPGMGTTPPDTSITSMDGFVAAVRTFVLARTQGEPFAIAGTSAGAAIAAAVASSLRSSVRGVLLRVPMLESDDAQRMTAGESFASDDERDDHYDADRQEPNMPAAFYAEAAEKRSLLWQPARSRAARNRNYLEPIRNDPDRYRASPPSEPVNTPALIIAGRQDTRVGYDEVFRLMPLLPRATVAVLDRAGHVLPSGDTRLFGELVRDWLRRVQESWTA